MPKNGEYFLLEVLVIICVAYFFVY